MTKKTGKTKKAEKPAAAKKQAAKAITKEKQKGSPDPKATPKDELVVFAFRLLRSERDLIHKVAGSAKASNFVKGVVLATARRDLDTVKAIIEKGIA